MNRPSHNTRDDGADVSGNTIILLLLIISSSWVANLGADWLQYGSLITTFGLSLLVTPVRMISKFLLLSFLFLSFSVFFVSILRPGGLAQSDVLFLIHITIGFLAASRFSQHPKIALLLFVNIMHILTISSLVLFPIVFIAPTMIASVPDVLQNYFEEIYRAEKRIYTLFGVSYFTSASGFENIWRNQSIFWEPGMLGYFATIALLLSDSLGVGWKKKAVFVCGVLSSMAPGAFALLLLYLATRFAGAAKRGVLASALIIIASILIAVFTLPIIREIVLSVFGRDIANDPSINVRATDLWLPYVVALESPWWGFSNIDTYDTAMRAEIGRGMNSNTNSVGAYFYRYGYIWSFAFLCWIFLVYIRAKPEYGAVPLILLVGVMYEPIGFSAVFIFIIFVTMLNSRRKSNLIE